MKLTDAIGSLKFHPARKRSRVDTGRGNGRNEIGATRLTYWTC